MRLRYSQISQLNWASALKQLLGDIRPDATKSEPLSAESISSFAMMQDLANDPSRHFIRTPFNHETSDTEYSKRWAMTEGEQFVCLLDLIPDTQSFAIKLTIATKLRIETNPPFDFDLDSVYHNAYAYFHLHASYNREAIQKLWIDDRGLAPSLQGHGLLKPITMSLINPLADMVSSTATIGNEAFHIATLRFMKPTQWKQALQSHRIFIQIDPSNGDLIGETQDQYRSIHCKVNAHQLFNYHNKKLAERRITQKNNSLTQVHTFTNAFINTSQYSTIAFLLQHPIQHAS